MSRATVRSAIATYLQNADIKYLTTVKPFPAKFTSEMEFFEGEDPAIDAGAIIYIYIERGSEKRIALGGATDGRKAVEYSVALDCIFRSQAILTQDAGAENEDFLDSLIDAIRADRNAGNPSVIFQWGEGTYPGATDIDVVSYYPRSLRGAQSSTQVVSRVTIAVVEIIEA